MSRLLKNGLLLCLTVSSAAFVGCSDDNDGLPPSGDAGTHSDAGATHDASVGSLDSGSPSIDSGLSDAGTTPDASLGTTLHATLTTAQESPPCQQANPGATGSATVTISPDNSTLEVQVTYSGLSGTGAPTMGHIHYGDTGVSGGVVLPFSGSLASPITQTLTATNYAAVSGAPATFAEFITGLKAGHAYVNLHTTACASGEIRGQIQ